ncbi:zinc-dependent alcohol dehydrogenase family protein [Candidatus Eisenbacteria bacterium]|uniref:alcohol dehydrogenase n=1 Tax=Eiseniibacteriota bacterium TaxID=2212470 RepID=A0ABV6YLY9_UNCEI
MKAMVLENIGQPLQCRDLPMPEPSPNQVLIRVHACAVCRTDLHVYDGDLTEPKLPLVLGHEIVGTIEKLGANIKGLVAGQRIGVPWLGHTCGTCRYCVSDRENLCDNAGFTGYQIDGGFAEYTVADHNFCFPIPRRYSDIDAAPLLCAGLIGFRALRLAGDASRLGLYGFGAAAHIIAQVAHHQGREVYAFTRPGSTDKQAFAKKLGAVWADDSDATPPHPLDAAIIFAPVGALLPISLQHIVKGGVVVCAGIHMDTIPAFEYDLLWGERVVRSVANLTRRDGHDFLELAPQVPVRTQVEPFALEDANQALERLRSGTIEGAAVLVVHSS